MFFLNHPGYTKANELSARVEQKQIGINWQVGESFRSTELMD